MNKQIKDKVEFLKFRYRELLMEENPLAEGTVYAGDLQNLFNLIEETMTSSSPALKPGDKVRHKDYEQYGIGRIHKISKSGERAFIRPWDAYYRLDKLILVEDKQNANY